jgi:hypothetical protein
MTRGTKIALAAGGMLAALPIIAGLVLFLGPFELQPAQVLRREISLPDGGSVIIDGTRRGRSEHGFSQRAGYRPPGSQIEWFGDLSDGVAPQIHHAGPLLVVIDLPAACLFVRNPDHREKWKSFALVFPDDLGPFPISFYAERNGLTPKEVARIDQLGGQHERKYPTTYIQSFDTQTGDLQCSYQLDNNSAWFLHLRLSEDGTPLP